MITNSEKKPDPKKLEKEIGDFLSKKFGDNVKIVSPLMVPQKSPVEETAPLKNPGKKIDFDLKPEELVAYLDRYIVKQDDAKAILATKICTHFNRIKYAEQSPETIRDIVGSIKNNVLMIGPTGVGKTYMVRLIARKIGIPFVKGDATKFSETGYVGGDVEDLVRDLVREADGDIELAQYGIIYIDEIDKIASSRNLIGADVSRTGVQRALLKPLEETDVELKVPHDPISMIQEIERFRKTGKREQSTINTRNILFIVSGAFSGLPEIIEKRLNAQSIGFGAPMSRSDKSYKVIRKIKSEDLIEFGFESEFVGRLPVRAVFEELTAKDLYQILKNPNNPIVLSKKLDFAAYGIDIRFEDDLLKKLAQNAFKENTGARGLVSSVERALLPFEKALPSASCRKFPATTAILKKTQRVLDQLLESPEDDAVDKTFDRLVQAEQQTVEQYILDNWQNLAGEYNLPATHARGRLAAHYYSRHINDVGSVIRKINTCYNEIKNIELYFFKNHDINIIFEEDAIDHIIEAFILGQSNADAFYQQLQTDFKLGLKLIMEKTGRNRFFITRKALLSPERFLETLVKQELSNIETKTETK